MRVMCHVLKCKLHECINEKNVSFFQVKSLKGQVESKNIAILNGFGNPFEVKVEYLQIYSNNGDISNRLHRIMEMITEFSTVRGFLKDLQGSLLDDDVVEADEIIKSFNLQRKAELKGLGIGLGVQSGFALFEVLSLSFTAASTATAVLSAVGAVLSVAMFIFNVVHSVQKERKVRDDLIDAKSKLLRQMTRLREAEKQIQLFCFRVCETDVVFLKNILQKFADFLQNNQKYSDILKWNKDVSTLFIKYDACNPSQVTLNNLKRLKHIQKQLIDLLDKDIEGLKKAIEKAQNWNHLKENILEKAQKQYSVEKIMLTIPDLKTRKETLVLIAAFLPNIDCYWGYDLEKIRKKEFSSPLLEIPVTESLIQKILIMIRFDFPLINLKMMLCSNINCASSGVEMQLVALAKPDMQFYQSQYLPNFPCRNSLPSSVTML